LESDDINSVLKSPIIKSRKKRRKRSSWATGVIKKAKKPVKNSEEVENEPNEEPQENILSLEAAPNGILVKDEDKVEEQMDTSVVEGPVLDPNGLEDSRVQVKTSRILNIFCFYSSNVTLFGFVVPNPVSSTGSQMLRSREYTASVSHSRAVVAISTSDGDDLIM